MPTVTYRKEQDLLVIYRYHISDTFTLLDGAINATQTTITVDDTSAFTASGYLQIENETILYTGKTATTFTGCTRGSEGSVKASHADNTPIYQSAYSANQAANAAFDYFDNAAKVNDCIYFNASTNYYFWWEDLKLYIGTAFAATSVTFVWEYFWGTWQTVPILWDGTNGFTALGECHILWDMLAGYNWYTAYGPTINGAYSEGLWIRCRITAINTPTEGGANSTNKARCWNGDIWITGTGGSFATLSNTDKAGTCTLLKGRIDANPDTFSLGKQVRPAEEGAQRLSISCTVRAGATCDISGTDSEGNAISETGIDISSGSATTIKSFKTVSTSGITVNGMTNGDSFDITQGRWGVIWRMGEGDTKTRAA